MTLLATVRNAQINRLSRVRRLLDMAERARAYGERHAQAALFLGASPLEQDFAERRFEQARQLVTLADRALRGAA